MVRIVIPGTDPKTDMQFSLRCLPTRPEITGSVEVRPVTDALRPESRIGLGALSTILRGTLATIPRWGRARSAKDYDQLL